MKTTPPVEAESIPPKTAVEVEAELAARMEGLRRERAQTCWLEMLAVADKHRCDLAAIIEVSNDGRQAVAHPIIVPRP